MPEFQRQLTRFIREPDLRARCGQVAAEDAKIYFDIQRVTDATVQPLLRLAGIDVVAS